MKRYLQIFCILTTLFFTPLIGENIQIEEQIKLDQIADNEILEVDRMAFENSEDVPKEFDYWKEFFKMMLILGIILTVVLVIAYFLKNFLNQKTKILNQNNHIKILEKRNLSQKSLVYLIEVNGKQMVLSESSNNGVHFMGEVPAKGLDEIAEEIELKKSNKKPTFSEIIQNKMGEKLNLNNKKSKK